MALGGVFMTDTDGNIGVQKLNLSEKVCGLLFDISGQSGFWTTGTGASAAATLKDTVVEFNTLDDAVKAGITEYSELTATTAADYILNGVAYYHIKRFFNLVGGSGRLFVMFADCSSNWNALVEMQNAAQGQISQFGVWTEQNLWKKVNANDTEYTAQSIILDLNTVAAQLANEYHAPATILLNANVAQVATATDPEDTVALSKIPNIIGSNRYVAVLLGQDINTDVSAIQHSLDSKTPVGNLGVALGSLVLSSVGESIGWVQQHNLSDYFANIEFGFGDVSETDNEFGSTTPYESLTRAQIDALDEKGYIFLCRYAGIEGGVFFSGDQTCSDGDYRTISRNRVINKARRSVRTALLPYVNSPIKVDPATGHLSTAQITVFSNLVTDILNAMVSAEEISGIGSVTIPADQNILQNDTLIIKFTLIPLGTAKRIEVTEGLVISQ